MGSQWAVGEVWWGDTGLWERYRGVIWGCGRVVEGSHMGVGERWWGYMGLWERCGGVKLCCGRVVAGSYRVVGKVFIVAMTTCGLHLGKGVVDSTYI